MLNGFKRIIANNQISRIRKTSSLTISCSYSRKSQEAPEAAKDHEKPNKWLANIARKSEPYLSLIRIRNPSGSLLLFWPCTWGIELATPLGQLPDPYTLLLFGTGAILMRGAGCTINDIWDRKLDQHVTRTKNRPLANNTLTVSQAIKFLAVQLSFSLAILLQMNWNSVMLGASSLALVVTYPLMKRVTYWPQLVLGLAFNWGVLLGYCCMHGSVDWAVCLPVYLAGVCWSIIYDTIYAHQDKLDDLRIGIKSTALKFNENTKKYLSLFSASMIALLAGDGLICNQCWPYYTSLLLVSSHLAYQIVILDTDSSETCFRLFKTNTHIGLLIFLGLLTNNFVKNRKNKQNQ